MDNTFFVYILYSATVDKYYVGHTNDINRRLTEHNDLLADSGKYCVKNGPWKLVYSESRFQTRADAMAREKQIKSWKSRKKIEEIIKNKTHGTISSVGIPMRHRD